MSTTPRTAESLFNEWSGKAYQWDALPVDSVERQRWIKFAVIFNESHATLETELMEAKREVEKFKEKNLAWALGVEQSNTDIVDMQRDECKRIRALCHGVGVRGQEIQGICDRAIACIEQTVPVVVQRDQLQKERDTLKQQLAETQAAAGFCEEHKPNGGARNCLVCGCIELSHALHQIDYIFSEKNEMGVSDFDLHGDPELVAKRTKQKVAELAASEAKLREAASDFVYNVKKQNVSGWGEREIWVDASFRQIEQALSTTPSTALAECMKPWREFVEELVKFSHLNVHYVQAKARELLKTL